MSRPEYGSDLHLWNQPEAVARPDRQPHRFVGGGYEDPTLCMECADFELRPWHIGQAVARSTDPGTSWEAARSITPEKLRESQKRVLTIIEMFGPMTDEELVLQTTGRMSPSGARSRRSELVAMGLVRDSGRKDTLRSGRRAIVWEAV